MNGERRTVLNYVAEVFWIYVRFMVLAAIIFFLVLWYMRTYGDAEHQAVLDAVADEQASKREL